MRFGGRSGQAHVPGNLHAQRHEELQLHQLHSCRCERIPRYRCVHVLHEARKVCMHGIGNRADHRLGHCAAGFLCRDLSQQHSGRSRFGSHHRHRVLPWNVRARLRHLRPSHHAHRGLDRMRFLRMENRPRRSLDDSPAKRRQLRNARSVELKRICTMDESRVSNNLLHVGRGNLRSDCEGPVQRPCSRRGHRPLPS